LLRVLTDLYVQQSAHTAEEEVQYIERSIFLIEFFVALTLVVVRRRMSAISAAPAAVLARLHAPASPAPPARPQRRSDDASPENLAMAFFMAGTDERRLILTSIAAAAEPKLDPPAPASSEMLRQLEAATLKRDSREAAKLLEHALAISADIAARIVRDRSGEPILIAAKALGMKGSMLQRVLLFLNPSIGQSVERVYDLARLYDEIAMGTAAHMLAIWREAGPRRHQQHAPVYWDDEQRGARSTATPVSASRSAASSKLKADAIKQ
jgi:hypothetical protein